MIYCTQCKGLVPPDEHYISFSPCGCILHEDCFYNSKTWVDDPRTQQFIDPELLEKQKPLVPCPFCLNDIHFISSPHEHKLIWECPFYFIYIRIKDILKAGKFKGFWATEDGQPNNKSLFHNLIVQFHQGGPDEIDVNMGIEDLGNKILNYYYGMIMPDAVDSRYEASYLFTMRNEKVEYKKCIEEISKDPICLFAFYGHIDDVIRHVQQRRGMDVSTHLKKSEDSSLANLSNLEGFFDLYHQ